MIPPLGLRSKLVAVTLGLLALLTAGALLTVRHYFGQQLRHQAEKKLRASATVLRSILEKSGYQLLERANLLVELPSLQAAMTRNQEQLEPLLNEVKAIRAANLLWATDPAGVVIACTGESPPVGQDLSGNGMVSAALNGREGLGFDLMNGEWWLLLSLPVKGGSSSTSLGTVNLALLIGETYLTRLSDLIDTEVGFLWREHQLWSEGWPHSVRGAVAALAQKAWQDPARMELPLREGQFLWLSRPVTGGSPPIATGPRAVLGIHLEESVIQRSTWVIVGIALLVMVIGAILSIWAIRPLVRQLEQVQVHLLKSEKLASIGQLAAGVAHELNNPLMVIMGNTQLALRMLTRETVPPQELIPKLKQLLHDLNQESNRSKSIVNTLLDFARVRPPSRAAIDIHTLLDDSLKLVDHQASLQSIQVVRQYTEDLPSIQVDPDQIKQVFVNVILNAVQAMPTGGTLTLRTSADNRQVEITVQDTGVGIPQEEIEKVFDPFYSTKPVGVGTGLGLFVSYGIVQRHQGNVSLTSQLGEGTTVTIQLPI